MKTKSTVDKPSLIVIIAFLANTILGIFHYITEPNVLTLIFKLIVTPCFLVIFIFILFVIKVYDNKHYLIIYNDFFEIYDKSIFDAKLICERKNKKYLKYGLTSNSEKKYAFTYNGLSITFGLMVIDNNRKLMIIYKIKSHDNKFYEALLESKNKAKHRYYENNDIPPLEGENVFYKNSRNAFRIEEVNGKFNVLKYRHCVPIDIHNIKALSTYTVGWECIGGSYEDFRHSFETFSEAKDYIDA